MPTTMRPLPHLPLLPAQVSLDTLKSAGVPKSIISELLGVSRMQVTRWYAGVSSPNALSREALSVLAHRVRRAEGLGRLTKKPTGVREWSAALAIEDPLFPYEVRHNITPETLHVAD